MKATPANYQLNCTFGALVRVLTIAVNLRKKTPGKQTDLNFRAKNQKVYGLSFKIRF
jgi:hypothetical protein